MEFLVVDGAVDPGSITVTGALKTVMTHLPDFVIDVMRAVNVAYGIDPPNLEYTTVDLLTYSHANTTANPYFNKEVPGRAYINRFSKPNLHNGCVNVKSVSGGLIGIKPMLTYPPLRASVESWYDRVRTAYESGRTPRVVRDWANAVYNNFFRKYDPILPGAFGSPFYFAPPIWIEQEFGVCPDGSVAPGQGESGIADIGYMPSLFLYLDGQAVDMQGQPKLGGGPVLKGDFDPFTIPAVGTSDTRTPWNTCRLQEQHSEYRNRRDGSPVEPAIPACRPHS